MSIIIAHFTPHPDEPHETIRRLALDFEHMLWSERKLVLQALPLPDLTQLARVLVEHHPTKWRTPDLTWGWLRLMIEPLTWDIRLELRNDGPNYVAYWAGRDFLRKSAEPDVRADNLIALDKDMQHFFDALYPRRLIDVGTEVIYAA